jgi:hypothetical protein
LLRREATYDVTQSIVVTEAISAWHDSISTYAVRFPLMPCKFDSCMPCDFDLCHANSTYAMQFRLMPCDFDLCHAFSTYAMRF